MVYMVLLLVTDIDAGAGTRMRWGEVPAPVRPLPIPWPVLDKLHSNTGLTQCLAGGCGPRDEVPNATTVKEMAWTTRGAPFRVGNSGDI